MPINISRPHPDTVCIVFTKVTSDELNEAFKAMDDTLAENPKTAKIIIDVSGGYELSRNSAKSFKSRIKSFSCKSNGGTEVHILFLVFFFLTNECLESFCTHHKLATLMKPALIGKKFKTFPSGSLEEPIAWCAEQ